MGISILAKELGGDIAFLRRNVNIEQIQIVAEFHYKSASEIWSHRTQDACKEQAKTC